MNRTLAVVTLLLLAVAGALADRGSIPFKPNVRVFEPNQRAMIAWNGKEEILLLSTDLHASEATKVLEVIPLPAKPEVKKGDAKVFVKATNLINAKLPQPAPLSLDHTRGTKASPQRSRPAGEVVLHEKIGAHDISVIHVLNNQGFITWVETYLKKQGVEKPVIPNTLKQSVNEYLQEKFAWFVFDVVSLDVKPKTNDAIQYRFASASLFYPLKISRTDAGNTKIDLLILTPQLLNNFTGIPIKQVRLMHQPIPLTSRELRSLNPDMDTLLGHREDMKLRIWRLEGKLSSFDKDLKANRKG
ncbi:MAG: DUF2330 domain-containing protein [Armatimonadota bacterium]